MTILRCSATTCIYNKEELCSKGDIMVDGSTASRAEETCCSSFRERKADSMKNSVSEGCGCEKISVDCAAHNCTYNEHCRCTAAAIDVSGDGACSPQDTRCSTFECRC